jgi:putative nucleotidyltransferase with HDIG domain
MVFSLMSLIELRDHGMSAHSHAVSDLATAIAQAMGVLPQQVQLIGTAGLVHDIGKVGIPDALLQHAGRFSANERSVIRLHPEVGAEILSASLSLQDLVPAVRHHHERWDGEGYPDQLRGTHIPLAARIIAVAEAYDAIGRGSSYQASRSQEEAVAELRRGAGTQFDPAVVQALLAILTQQHVQEQTMQAAGA